MFDGVIAEIARVADDKKMTGRWRRGTRNRRGAPSMSEIKALTVPKWGMAMDEGTLLNWLVEQGACVKVGDEIAEIESSKIVNVLQTDTAGVLRRQVAVKDQVLPVGALLAVIADGSVSDEEIDAFVRNFAAGSSVVGIQNAPEFSPARDSGEPSAAGIGETPATTTWGVPDVLKRGDDDRDVRATPHAKRLAARIGLNLHNVAPGGRHGRIGVRDIEKAVADAGGSLGRLDLAEPGARHGTGQRDDSEVPATPLARRLARKLGINLRDCRASGTRGRVCKADVEGADIAHHRGATRAVAQGREMGTASEGIDEIPMSGMRRTIARRLQGSTATIPHYRMIAEAEIDALLALRAELNEALRQANVSVNDLLVKACAAALVQVPDCNVQLHGETIKRFQDADIAVAVALEAGLVTPVVRAANRKGLVQISSEIQELVTRVKAGTLTAEAFEGGTFTLSNLGMYGVRQFDAIINPPQCAIVAVGKGAPRMVVKQGKGVVATVMTLTLSLDHRVIDGAVGARFLQALVQFIEHPGLLSA